MTDPEPEGEEAMAADRNVATLRYVNGVFKGGGAKGVAYAGALHAVRERGLWFKSVAGASAGAVTATLIASGMGPDEVQLAVPLALQSARASWIRRLTSAALGRRSSIYESHGIRDWLDATLRTRIKKTAAGPVTFAELHAATGIELYVLAMDLANSHPMVFSRRTTPDVDVAGAVAASSAIPGAFPAGRGVFMSPAHGATVHALVDGGTWANYPSFVFQDRSFRTWLRATSEARTTWADADEQKWDEESSRALVGFVLGGPEPLSERALIGMVPVHGPEVDARFDRGPTYSSSNRALYLIDLLLSSGPVRLMVVVAMTTWVILTLLASSIMARRLSVWLAQWVPDPLYPLALVGLLSMVVIAAVVAIGLVVSLVLVGRLVADTLLPSMKALIGVPTGVAPWIGMGSDSVVLEVPFGDLSTVSFSVPDQAARSAVAEAHRQVTEQLSRPEIGERLERLLSPEKHPEERPEERPVLRPTAVPPAVFPDRLMLRGALSIVGAMVVVGGLGWWGVNIVDASGVPAILGSLLAGILVGGAAMVSVGGRASALAGARSRLGVMPSDRRRTNTMMALAALAGFALIVGGAVLSWVAMQDRNDSTSMAIVVSGQDDGAYTVEIRGHDTPVTLDDASRLRIGERVFVEVDHTTETARLVGALDDRRFPFSIVMWIMGISLAISAVRRYRWDVRCRRLAVLAASIEPADWRVTS